MPNTELYHNKQGRVTHYRGQSEFDRALAWYRFAKFTSTVSNSSQVCCFPACSEYHDSLSNLFSHIFIFLLLLILLSESESNLQPYVF